MSVPQQQIINALVQVFGDATGLTIYDTSAPYAEAAPVGEIVVTSDPPDDAFPAGPANTAHGITFELAFYVDRKVGPAALRSYGQLALSRHQTEVPSANDGQNVVRCTDRGGPAVQDNNYLVLRQTWFYQGGF